MNKKWYIVIVAVIIIAVAFLALSGIGPKHATSSASGLVKVVVG